MKLFLLAVLVKLSVAVVIDCDFRNDLNGKYTCFVSDDLETNDFDNFVTDISGTHIDGNHSDEDVKHFYVSDKDVEYFPGGLVNRFPNLEAITVKNSKLKYIFKDDLAGLSKLTYFAAVGNQIRTVAPKLFEDNPDLDEIHFESNKISSISDDLLDYSNVKKLKAVHFFDNECIDKDLEIPNPRATDIKQMIQSKCQLTNKKLMTIVDKQLEKLQNRNDNLQEQLTDAKKKTVSGKISPEETVKEAEKLKSKIVKLLYEKENLSAKFNVSLLSLDESVSQVKNLTNENENLKTTLKTLSAIESRLEVLNEKLEKLESSEKEKDLEIQKLSNELQKSKKSSETAIASLKSVNYELKKQATFSSANDAHYESLKARYLREDVDKKKTEGVTKGLKFMSF